MITLIGTAGASIILFFFLLNQFHKIDRDSIWYDIGNFIGSGLLVVYAYLLSSIPFLILNAVWALVSLRDIFGDTKTQSKTQIST
ncbi:MAG: hypothetical protein Q7K44_04615 [Candidatus Liptonbacteria bacterium]|nr:hypothetical protein [Candidatus Liptonbacteria bacterium]